MIEGRYHRGFSEERLAASKEPKVRKDDKGYYIMSLSEKSKVYFEDYYQFLELTYDKARAERSRMNEKLFTTSSENVETLSYYILSGQRRYCRSLDEDYYPFLH